MQSLPEFTQWMNPLLTALRELGGTARPSEAVEKVATDRKVPDTVLDQTNQNGGSRFANQVHWARYYLAETDYIDRSKRGVWKLTAKGQSVATLDLDQIRTVLEDVRLASLAQKATRSASARATKKHNNAELEIAPEDAPGDHRSELPGILKSLSAPGFERLCQRLLREAGFEQVRVTGRSGDGGIDGDGVLALNAFVSFRVLFQCKRYEGAVGPAQVRDFRGAMQGRADKGIILTTGSFTAEAKREAARDGVPPIELVDMDKLIALFESLELGLVSRTTFDVDRGFFAEYADHR